MNKKENQDNPMTPQNPGRKVKPEDVITSYLDKAIAFNEYTGMFFGEDRVKEMMKLYGKHKMKEVRYEAIDIVMSYDRDTELGELADFICRDIENIK